MSISQRKKKKTWDMWLRFINTAVITLFFFCDTFSTAVGHMVRSPVLEGGGWGGGGSSPRASARRSKKRGRVAVGVVGGAQG